MPIDECFDAPADAVERALPATSDAAPADTRAEALLRRADAACRRVGVDRDSVRAVVRIAVLRMAHRYGPFGDDRHAYHNEEHALGLLERTLPALLAAAPLDTADREALVLFCACHDLRQRECGPAVGPIGADEAASIAETARLLAAQGLNDRRLHLALRFAIAGSTFANGTEDAEKGALVHRLGAWLDGSKPCWRDDADAVNAERLARIAADLDTGSIGAPYAEFAAQAAALAVELQYRAGRPLDSRAAAAACLQFLGEGQRHYVDALHRFASAEGRAAFGERRDANARRCAKTARDLAERFPVAPADAHAVLAAFAAITAAP
ncbi:MAG TPA: hypothetical protein DCM32_09120 [Xanthomonadaceae bacterium]|jgi:hypothetical protein|nr:hypothetical protein [Xanthomonadaceae bacterium]